jgi:hypothetical protein
MRMRPDMLNGSLEVGEKALGHAGLRVTYP